MSKLPQRWKYGKRGIDWIADNIVKEQLSIPELAKKYPTKCPPPDIIRTWKYKYPYAKEKINEAYLSLFETIADELIELRKAGFPENSTRDEILRLDKLYGHRKTVISNILKQVAPVFSAQFRETKKVEHSGKVETGFNIVLQDYSTPEIKDITPKLEGDENE